MKKNLLIWGTALILVLAAIYVTKFHSSGVNIPSQSPSLQNQSAAQQTQPASIDLSSSEKAIDFTLTDLDGNKVSLKDLKGKNVYINFWATWCPWCVKELPDIEKIYQQYKDKDLVVLAVDIGESQDTVQSFVKQNNLNFKVLLDTDQSIAQAYGISSIPVSIFIDKKGNVAAKRVGALSEEELQSYVKGLLQ